MQHNGQVEKLNKVKKFSHDEYQERIATKKKKKSKRIPREDYSLQED